MNTRPAAGRDDGLTEVVGFVFIISIFIMFIIVFMLVGVPIIAETKEVEHNSAVALQFSQLKSNIDTMCIASETGLKRSSVITLSPTGDHSKITVLPDLITPGSYGAVRISYGGDEVTLASGLSCYPVNITYESANIYADNIRLSYQGGMLTSNGNLMLGPLYNSTASPALRYVAAVDSTTKEQTIGGSDTVTLEYTLLYTYEKDQTMYCVFSMRLR